MDSFELFKCSHLKDEDKEVVSFGLFGGKFEERISFFSSLPELLMLSNDNDRIPWKM